MKTLLIFGPSGVGKSPLEELLKPEIQRVNPYRLRPSGPRGPDDFYYAHPDLEDQLSASFKRLGDSPLKIADCIQWYPKAMVLVFPVRDRKQILFLSNFRQTLAKAEIYAPVFVKLLEHPDLRLLFGELQIILLNPASVSVVSEDVESVIQELKEHTGRNLRERGDSEKAIEQRVASIDEEFPAWQRLIRDYNGIEYVNWQFPEYRYNREDRFSVLRQAKTALLEGCRDLAMFFQEI